MQFLIVADVIEPERVAQHVLAQRLDDELVGEAQQVQVHLGGGQSLHAEHLVAMQRPCAHGPSAHPEVAMYAIEPLKIQINGEELLNVLVRDKWFVGVARERGQRLQVRQRDVSRRLEDGLLTVVCGAIGQRCVRNGEGGPGWNGARSERRLQCGCSDLGPLALVPLQGVERRAAEGQTYRLCGLLSHGSCSGRALRASDRSHEQELERFCSRCSG